MTDSTANALVNAVAFNNKKEPKDKRSQAKSITTN